MLVRTFIVVGLGAIAAIGAGLSFGARSTQFAETLKAAKSDQPVAAWTELGSEPDGTQVQSVRAIMPAGSSCPELVWDSGHTPMTLRAGPDGSFKDTVCEAALPDGATNAKVDGVAVPVRKKVIETVAVLGDTGCKKQQGTCEPEG